MASAYQCCLLVNIFTSVPDDVGQEESLVITHQKRLFFYWTSFSVKAVDELPSQVIAEVTSGSL